MILTVHEIHHLGCAFSGGLGGLRLDWAVFWFLVDTECLLQVDHAGGLMCGTGTLGGLCTDWKKTAEAGSCSGTV